MTPRLPDRCPSGLTWPSEIALQSGLFLGWAWWQCSCGHEVRADQLRCPLAWCRRSRTGVICEH